MNQFSTDLGIIVIDHGSKVAAANETLDDIVRVFQEVTGAAIVQPAHMELAEPTIPQAFARCVELGATRIVAHPYMLAPGRHSTNDIPRMVAEAAEQFLEIPFSVSEPLGVDSRLAELIAQRLEESLNNMD